MCGLKHQKEKRSMDYFAGLDVSVKETRVCIVDDAGKIGREARVASEPEAQLADANGNEVGSPVDPSSFSSLMVNPAPPDATTANMVLRNAPNTTATYQIYNLGANSILAGSAPLGQVGSDWGFVTLGNFNSSDPSDMLLRNATTGTFQVYDIANNNIISSTPLGTVGVEWQPMAFGTFGSFGETDMILRDVNTSDLQVYQIDNNEITAS